MPVAINDCTIKIAPDGCISVHYVVTNFRPYLTLILLIGMEECVGVRHDVRCHTAQKSRASAMGRQEGRCAPPLHPLEDGCGKIRAGRLLQSQRWDALVSCCNIESPNYRGEEDVPLAHERCCSDQAKEYGSARTLYGIRATACTVVPPPSS